MACTDCEDGPCYMNCGPAVRLPDGWTWDRVRSERVKWGLADDLVPVATGRGYVAWVMINSLRFRTAA